MPLNLKNKFVFFYLLHNRILSKALKLAFCLAQNLKTKLYKTTGDSYYTGVRVNVT